MSDHAGWFALLAPTILKFVFRPRSTLIRDKGAVRVKAGPFEASVRWEREYQPPKR